MAYSFLAPWIGGAGSAPSGVQGGFQTPLPFFRGGGGVGEDPEPEIKRRRGGGHGATVVQRKISFGGAVTDDEVLAVVAFLITKEVIH